MKKKDDLIKRVSLCIMINIFYIFASSYIFATFDILHKYFSYGYYGLLIMNLIFIFFTYKKGLYKKNIIHIFIILLVLFGVISTIFAINKKVSMFGFNNRDEGLFMIIYYLSILYLGSILDNNSKKMLVYFILITGLVQCIYAILQVYKVPFVNVIYNPQTDTVKTATGIKVVKYLWATGFLRNPNFFGAYMLLCLCFSVGMFVDEKLSKKSIIYIFLITLFLYGLLISNTTSVLVAFMLSLLYLFIYMIKNKYYKKILIGLLILFSTLSVGYFTGKTTFVKDLHETGGQAIEISKGNVNERFGTKRIHIWRNTIKIVPKNILHGVGIDNFYFAFDGKPLESPLKMEKYDKAHNEYLQILITEGIFALVTYLGMCLIIVYWGIKDSFKNKNVLFILPVVGYLVHAFFSISVIEVSPIFYLAMGFCVNNKFDSYKRIKI